MQTTTPHTPQPVTFRHFTRGGWAVFASLGRTVRIGVLTVGMLGSVCIEKVDAKRITTFGTAAANADEGGDDGPDGGGTSLSEVTVAGSLAPLTQLQSARIVGVIGRQEIEASAAQTVNDLLKLASGVDVRQRGGFGIQTDISIDGGTFDQITILLNGVNISNPHTGHLAADFPVGLTDIERIEVLEGAASRVYGASAFGGAINIVTRQAAPLPHPAGEAQASRPCAFAVEAGAHGGSYGTFGGDARVSLATGAMSSAAVSQTSAAGLSLSGGYQRSDGATTNSDFSRGHAFLRGEWQTDGAALHLQAGWSRKSYGANTFYSAAYPDQWERNNRIIVSLGAETTGRVRVRPEVYWTRSTDNFELIRGTATGENFHRTDVGGTRLSLDGAWAAGHTAAGVELRGEGIYSTNLGHPLLSAAAQPAIGGEELRYTRHDRRTNIALNAEHTVALERLTASVGLLANWNSLGGGLRLYPGADVAWRPVARLRLFASYNKGFRLPTFTDLYYKAPTHAGNSGLRAEESHCVQLGAAWRDEVVQATARVFYNRGTHMIDWVMYTPDDIYHSANFDLDNIGAQAELKANLAAAFGTPGAYLQTASLAYTYMHQHRRDDTPIYKSNYAMEYLRHKLVATLAHRIYSRLTAAWTLRWQDRQGSYIRYDGTQPTGELVPYAPYATLDVRLRWTARHYELWAEATNLTNTTYYDLGNVPQPGIVVLAGARVRF